MQALGDVELLVMQALGDVELLVMQALGDVELLVMTLHRLCCTNTQCVSFFLTIIKHDRRFIDYHS